MQTANDIRAAFLDYFRKADHEVVASSPLVPNNDPTLMFVNSGMVQFKNVFTGADKRPYKRAVTSQKCVRAGGKHNDLDNVGYTARHHTFFEMLGNFSFGDYFKDQAIELAWNLITKEYGLSSDKLLVTVYYDDDQAWDLWKKIAGLPDERIIRIATADNFWSMGDTGPCGPCSEIFYDHGPDIAGGPPGSPDEDGDRFIEIWNLVFMQYEQVAPGERLDLPRPSIDTGMGLERIAAVMQGKHDNYDIDLMRHIMQAAADISGNAIDGPHHNGFRVIADHLRASSFLLADGVMPSNEGRGYVLRRIMRRAMRHVHMMGCSEALMWRLVPPLISQMGQAFPELGRAEALISETLKLEENRFKQTLDRGLRLLDQATDEIAEGGSLAGDMAFKLYDTYGFPYDLTEDVLRGRGLGVDRAGFDAAMEQQRSDARAAWSGSGDSATEALWFDIHQQQGASEFLGYGEDTAEAVVQALVVDGTLVDEAFAGVSVSVIVNQSPFYGESGGQQGDSGVISKIDDDALVTIDNSQKKLGTLIVHSGTLSGGALRVGDVVEMAIDAPRRARLRANHSATHLLHAALRDRLGDHVTQKGSLVAPDRLRFDFSQTRAVSRDEIARIEADVNAQIRRNTEVTTTLMSPEEAVAQGAMALSGENYGDEVRVLAMGAQEGSDEFGNISSAVRPYSVELCGGTHARRTGDIGLFKITSESAVASGVRRIEALTGAAAETHICDQEAQLAAAAGALKTTAAEVPARIEALIEQRKKLEREFTEARRASVMANNEQTSGDGGTDDALRDAGGVPYYARRLDAIPAKELRGLADDLKSKLGSAVIALVTVNDGKAALMVAVTDDLIDRISAVDLVRVGAEALGGKGGGGRPDMAQAGGPDGGQADAALDAIERAIR